MNFLRLLSEKAAQTFNVTCLGSQGCFDSTSNMVEKAIRLQGANDGLLSLMKDDPSIKITQVINNSRDCHHHPPHHYRHRYSHCHHIIFLRDEWKRKTKVIVLFVCAFKCVEVSRL